MRFDNGHIARDTGDGNPWHFFNATNEFGSARIDSVQTFSKMYEFWEKGLEVSPNGGLDEDTPGSDSILRVKSKCRGQELADAVRNPTPSAIHPTINATPPSGVAMPTHRVAPSARAYKLPLNNTIPTANASHAI